MSEPELQELPRVVVLLATHDGARYLGDQLRTIFDQQGVRVRVVASDDRSTDTTLELLQEAARRSPLDLLPPSELPLGNANSNFMRLIHDAPLGDAQYVAFSDQDDLWRDDKLRRAVDTLRLRGCQGYSSNVTAFWPDGSRRVLKKSQPQRRFDHLFESAGPGCTFVLTRRAFDAVRDWVRADYARARGLRIHDWALYAFVRANGMAWHIDSYSSIDYRQHGNNELGANVGMRAARNRFDQLVDGRFREEVLALLDAIDHDGPIATRLRRLSPVDRLVLAARAPACRRRLRESLVLATSFLLTGKRAP